MERKGKLSKKGSITRQKIFNASIQIFSQKGFTGASLSEIAENAGVNKSDIYNYFDSKKELYMEILNSYLINLNEVIKKSGIQNINDPEKKIKKLLSEWLDFLAENPYYTYILRWEFAKGLSCLKELTQSFNSTENKPFFIMLHDSIREGTASGHFTPDTDSTLTTASIYNICFGLFFSSEMINSVNKTDLLKAIENSEALKDNIIDLCLNILQERKTATS